MAAVAGFPCPCLLWGTALPPLTWLSSLPSSSPPCTLLIPPPSWARTWPSEDLFQAVLPLLVAEAGHNFTCRWLGPSHMQLPVWGIFLFHWALQRYFSTFRHSTLVMYLTRSITVTAALPLRRPVACIWCARVLVRCHYQML